MSADCIDVCNEIISRLSKLGFNLGDDEDHEPIFEALSQVKFVRAMADGELRES